MKHGCMVMTLKLSSSRLSGSRQIQHGSKKRVKFAAMSSPCWSFFPTFKALSTRNSYPLVKPSMASFTVTFWIGWGRAFSTNVQTSGRKTIGFSTMTTRQLTHHSLFDSSWLPKTLQWFPTPSIRLTSPPATFSYSPRWNYGCKGVVLTRLKRSTQKRKRLSTHIWELPGMHEIMGNMLGSLYTCPGVLLQRRQWKLGVTVRNFFLWSNSLNFWVASTYFF